MWVIFVLSEGKGREICYIVICADTINSRKRILIFGDFNNCAETKPDDVKYILLRMRMIIEDR